MFHPAGKGGSPRPRHLARALGLLAWAGIGRAQVALHDFSGDAAEGWFGSAVAGAGDVNSDGFADLIVGAWRDDANGADAGLARVFSGADGSALYTFHGDAAGDRFGVSVAGAGDVNADGFDDLIVGAVHDDNGPLDSGSARVFSGVDGSILFTFNGGFADDLFGGSVSGAGDVNGDGHADLVVGAIGMDNGGFAAGGARVLSGLNGSVLHNLIGSAFMDNFGSSVSGAGDVDADGFDDVIVGARGSDANGVESGRARVFSGDDGSILHTFDGLAAGDWFGESVGGAGDVNGDGFADLIVGARQADPAGLSSGSARVFSGADGSTMFTFTGSAVGDWFGDSVGGAGDVDGDGVPDLIVGASQSDENGTDSGSVLLFSGLDGSVLHALHGAAAGEWFGYSAGGAGDVDGDGLGDWIVGAFGNDSNGAESGRASVYSGEDLASSYCFGDGSGTVCPCNNAGAAGAGCANSAGAGGILTATGSASVGADDLAFAATQLLPSQPALLFQGVNAVNGGNGTPFGDGLRCAGGGVVRLGVAPPDASGAAAWGPGLALDGGWVAGETRYFQCWYRDPGGPCSSGFNLTHGLSVTFAN